MPIIWKSRTEGYFVDKDTKKEWERAKWEQANPTKPTEVIPSIPDPINQIPVLNEEKGK